MVRIQEASFQSAELADYLTIRVHAPCRRRSGTAGSTANQAGRLLFFFPVCTLYLPLFTIVVMRTQLTNQTNKTAHSAEAVRKTVIDGREAIGARGEQYKNTK